MQHALTAADQSASLDASEKVSDEMTQTGFVWHERFMGHNTGRASGPFLSDASGWLEPDWRHTENSDTKRRFRNLLDVSGLLDRLVRIDPRAATVEELCRFHTPAERIAIVDWDVHHGNGTQAGFYDDPSVLTISLHQDNCFPPGSGLIEETGEGAGEGFNINVPLPPGSGDGAYEAAFERVVVPALERFQPQLIIVASGLDASAMDPLGRMMLSPRGYGRLTEIMLDAAARLCDGRLVVEHEGGYSAELVPFCGLAIIERLAGIETDVKDTILQQFPEHMGQQALQPHEAALIERVIETAGL